jgi:hypothetical protein
MYKATLRDDASLEVRVLAHKKPSMEETPHMEDDAPTTTYNHVNHQARLDFAHKVLEERFGLLVGTSSSNSVDSADPIQANVVPIQDDPECPFKYNKLHLPRLSCFCQSCSKSDQRCVVPARDCAYPP